MMSEKNLFPTIEEEAQRAADELFEIKGHIKELITKLNQIEKRLKVIAPATKLKSLPKKDKQQRQAFSEEYLAKKYESLSTKFKADNAIVLSELQAINQEELIGLAKYLGCTIGKNPSQKSLRELILGRLRESKLLNDGIA